MDTASRPLLGRGANVAEVFVVGAIVVAAIYAGGKVFAPLALAIILAFVLTPPIQVLRRLGVPRVISILSVVLVFIAAAIGFGAVLTTQVATLADDLPSYQQTLRDKIHDLRGAGLASESMSRAGKALSDLQHELQRADAPAAGGEVAGGAPHAGASPPPGRPEPSVLPRADGKPLQVEIKEPAMSALEQLKAILAVLIDPLAVTGLVVLFLLFILMQREDVRDRVIKLLGTSDLGRSTAALNESADRLSRYLLTQTLANALFGTVIGTALWFLGVPSPVLWGILAGLMRFVPFIGSIISAIFPLILAAAIDPGWSTVGFTLLLFLIAEPVMGHIIDPMVQGRATGMTPLAVILSTVFWTMMWGPIGLVLAVPLTLVLVVFGKHIKQLEIFNILLGDDEPLSATQSFYQRVLSGDADEAADQAVRMGKDQPFESYVDLVVAPGLHLASRDFENGSADMARATKIDDTVGRMLENLKLLRDAEPDISERPDRSRVYCVAARSPIDLAGARVLAHMLGENCFSALACREEGLPTASEGPTIVVISDFAAAEGHSNTKFLIRRIKRRLAGVRIFVANWNSEPPGKTQGATADAGVVSSFSEALRAVINVGTDSSQVEESEFPAGGSPISDRAA